MVDHDGTEHGKASMERLIQIRDKMDEILKLITEEREAGGASRELSLAFTAQEEARHWLRDHGDNRSFGY